MVIPTKQQLLVLLFGIPLSLFPLFHGSIGLALWLCYLFVVFVITILDYIIFPGAKKITCSLEIPAVCYIAASDQVKLTIEIPGSLQLRAHLFIVVSGPAKINIPEEEVILHPGSNTFSYVLHPLKRGRIIFPEVRIRFCSYLGSWWVQRHYRQQKFSRSIPNIRAVGKYALKFFSDPRMHSGLKVEKYRGEGSEFDSLREYMPGFDTRTIDWKVSARKGKIHCREFRAERNNEIILALDCGRLMAAELNGITKLDYAINSLLFITYFAIKSGDRIGFMAFGDKVYAYLPPQAKLSTLDRISHACEKISYNFNETNFVITMEYLLARQKKRTLVIVFSDFVDTISAELMKDYLGLLAQRYLVLFVAIRDPFLDQNLRQSPENLTDMYRQISCYNLKNERFKLISELKRLGINCLDIYPNQISIPLLNRYIEIRRREMI